MKSVILCGEKKYNVIPEVNNKLTKLNNSDLIVSLNLGDFNNFDKDSYNLVDMSSIRFKPSKNLFISSKYPGSSISLDTSIVITGISTFSINSSCLL